MNEIVGVKDKILITATKLAAESGIASINIRTVACKCDISIGTIYNHFPNKGDLVAAVIEDFWKNAFRGMNFGKLFSLAPMLALEEFYFELSNYLSNFRVNWLEQLSLLSSNQKEISRTREREMFAMITGIICKILKKNQNITTIYSTDELTQLSSFIFDNMLAMLRRGETDFTFARRILTKLLTI